MASTPHPIALVRRPHSLSAVSTFTGIAGILLGVIVGYILAAHHAENGNRHSVAAVATPPESTAIASDAEPAAYRDILTSDPTNAKGAEGLGNKLYDAGRYAEAIAYYQQALASDPNNVNVSTDLGIAMYYTGRADDALAQLQKSLAIDPTHGHTLFNIGIIKRDGKRDAKGAVEAWEHLLAVNPGYPQAARVRSLIAQSR